MVTRGWRRGCAAAESGHELAQIERLVRELQPFAKIEVEETVRSCGIELPIYSFQLGSAGPESPTVAFVGGVHGLEVIGTQVLIGFMSTLRQFLEWDPTTQMIFDKLRVLFYPCVNPGGMLLRTRSNPNGVDLMRNAPVEGTDLSPHFIMGGHRISPRLPWYRGPEGQEMEVENQALVRFMEREVLGRPFSLVLDLHSGFGMIDRVWFPYAFSRQPFPLLAEVMSLRRLLRRTYPHHVYSVEPQALHYTTHGDVWDYLSLRSQAQHPQACFIPLCLELGSWRWIRKNPLQMMSLLGIFNPVVPHREARTLRRHTYLLNFLIRATHSWTYWAKLSAEDRRSLCLEAKTFWPAW